MAHRRVYVFLDDSYTSTGHAGTREDPYSCEELVSEISTIAGNNSTYLLRGTRNYGTFISGHFPTLNSFIIAWDRDEYGPWRITTSPFSAFIYYGHIEDGIVQAASIVVDGSSKRMYFDILGTGNSRVSGNHENSTFYSVVSSNTIQVIKPSNNFTRCAFIGRQLLVSSTYTLNIDNCITDKPDFASFIVTASGTINDSSITYGWTPPSKPTSTSTDLTDFALGGGTPSDINSIGGVGYDEGWANGKTYFVNFSETSTGNNGYYGEDYIGWAEFIALTPDGLTFKCRGSKTMTASYSTAASDLYAIEDWSLSKYGPWRMDFGSTYDFNDQYASVKNGILYNLTSVPAINSFDRVFVNATSNINQYGSSMEDSTIVGGAVVTTFANCLINRCLIEGDGSGAAINANSVTATISNSKFGGSDFSSIQGNPLGTYNDGGGNEYGWATPSLPVFAEIDISEFALNETLHGVLNFPTYLYINLSTSNDTSISSGTSSSEPAAYMFLCDAVSYYRRTTFYARGYRDITSESTADLVWRNELIPFSDNKIVDWDNDSYGPWSVRANNATFSGVGLFNGIIYTNTDISISGYVIEPYTDVIKIRDVFFNAAGQVKIGSGAKDILGSNLISSSSPIAFFEEAPSKITDGWTYIEDPLVGGFNSWWSSEFTSGVNKFEIEERPPGSGTFVAVQNGSVVVRMTPSGVNLTGDFILNFCLSLADVNTGNISHKIFIRNSSSSSTESGVRYLPSTLEFYNIGSVSVPFEPYRKVFVRLTRTSGVITAEYSVDNNFSWISVSGSHSYSGDFFIETEGADNHGIGCFDFQVEGVSSGDSNSLPYGKKENDTNITDSVIDTPAVTVASWDYSSIDLQDVAQTDTTWSGAGIVYTGTNQQNLAISWPSWTPVASNTKEDFSFASVGSGITISGSGTYADYPEGLWGESRNNIGAFYFGLTLDLQGDTNNFVYKDPANEIIAKATFGGANYSASVSFEPLYDTGATSWSWDFGDGGTSALRTPTHEYVGEGVYTVSLYINGDTGTTVTKTGYIVVVKNLEFKVIVDPSVWYGGLPKTFDIGVTGATRPLDPVPDPPYEAFSWDLGNGDSDSNVTGLQYNGYTTEGVYTVEATARDIGVSGLDYTKQSVTSSTQLVVLSFTIDINPNSLLINNSVTYTITFTGTPPGNLRWDFGDGTPVHNKVSPGSSYSVSHTFTSAGIYDAILTLNAGLPTESSFTYSAGDPNLSELRVLVSDLSPNFNIVPSAGKIPLTGVFTDASIGTPTGWEWNFGDGFTGATTSPSIIHTYTGVGIFNPMMTVYDIYGFNASVSKTVTVSDRIGISITPTPGDVPQTLIFTPNNDSDIVQWDWEIIYEDPILGEIVVFNKTTTNALDKVFIQEIAAPTTYKVKLEATDSLGTAYTAVESFTTTESISILTNPPSGEAPLSVSFSLFNGQPSSISRLEWDFTNDGTVDSNEASPSHTYNNIGTYTVSLDLIWYLNSEETSSITVNKTVQVNTGASGLDIGFSANPSIGKAPLTVLFTGISNNAVSSWSWEIQGKGTVSTSQAFSHLFSSTGTYEVTLTVLDVFSQEASTTRSIIVTDTTTTNDEAIDPTDTDSFTGILTGSGNSVDFEDGGAKISIPLNLNETSSTGFVRKKGPSLIFD